MSKNQRRPGGGLHTCGILIYWRREFCKHCGGKRVLTIGAHCIFAGVEYLRSQKKQIITIGCNGRRDWSLYIAQRFAFLCFGLYNTDLHYLLTCAVYVFWRIHISNLYYSHIVVIYVNLTVYQRSIFFSLNIWKQCCLKHIPNKFWPVFSLMQMIPEKQHNVKFKHSLKTVIHTVLLK